VFGPDAFAWLPGVPPWLLGGLSLAAVFSVLAAALFVVAERAFDDVGRAAPQSGSVSSEGRRRREIREYLDAIDERYAEDHPVGSDHVAFYLPGRDVAVTFDAQAYFRIAGSGTTAVLCEHEMHGHHLGPRLPFEVPDVDYGEPVDEDDVVRAAFDALDLPVTADVETVRSAYRERVKDVHPDHGGSEEAFKRVRDAYTTAKDHATGGEEAARPARTGAS
jgi:DnaJ-domain-containing protein 1